MNGFIYIMSNPSFNDERIKIGISVSDPTQRKKELYSTGVPEPFKVEYYALVEDYENIEKVVHQELIDKRPNKNREFFNCSIEEAVFSIKYNAKIISENSFYQSHLNIKIQEEINQRKNRNEFLLKFDKSMNDISDEFNQKIELQNLKSKNITNSNNQESNQDELITYGIILFFFLFCLYFLII